MDLDSILLIGMAIFVFVVMIAIFSFIASKYKPKMPTVAVEGRIRIKGKENFSGTRVSVGRMKSKDKLAVSIVKDPEGKPLRSETDARGKFSFQGVPVGNFWLLIEHEGYKTMLKLVKLNKNDVNRLTDFTLE